jgi:general stress protein YciG
MVRPLAPEIRPQWPGACLLKKNRLGLAKKYVPALVALGLFAGLSQASAHDAADREAASSTAHEGGAESDDAFETKHLFGFTEGTDVGETGGREMEFETFANVGKRGGGRYNALDQEINYEAAPTSHFGYEATLHGVSQQIGNVPGLNNLSQTAFSGISVNPKWILLARGVDAPFGLAVSLQPEYDRIDPVTGAHSNNFVLGSRVYLDAELIEKKLYGAVNLIFSPEVDNETGVGISQYALFGATAALTWRLTPALAFGGEAEFYQAYNSLGFSQTTGSAAYLGPTLHWQVTPKVFVAMAWSSQISSQLPNNTPAALALYNQSDIARQRGRLTVGVEF